MSAPISPADKEARQKRVLEVRLGHGGLRVLTALDAVDVDRVAQLTRGEVGQLGRALPEVT